MRKMKAEMGNRKDLSRPSFVSRSDQRNQTMKRLLQILLMISPALWGMEGAMAQGEPEPAPPAVMYTYDPAGNRVQRSVLIVGFGKREDTTATEEAPPLPDELSDGHSIKAYPNPTNGLLHVAVSAGLLEEGPGRYWFYDLSGRTLREGSITESMVTLNLSSEAQGVYVLRVMAGGRKEEWRVVRTP